jgi:hypothetical protein
MPSSGLPIENFHKDGQSDEDARKMYLRIQQDAAHALKLGLFCEWLESFVGAWNATKDPIQASTAGITEWDM